MTQIENEVQLSININNIMTTISISFNFHGMGVWTTSKWSKPQVYIDWVCIKINLKPTSDQLS